MKNIKGQSLLFTISKKDPFYFFDYEIEKGEGVYITRLSKLTNEGIKSAKINIPLSFQPSVKFSNMQLKLEKDKSFSQELEKRKANYFGKLIKLCKAKEFDKTAMLDLIEETDIYANLSKMYDEMIKRIERKDLD